MARSDLTWRRLLLRLLQRLATGLAVWALAAPLALYFGLALLLRLVYSPLSGFWRPKPRPQPPAALRDSALGQHDFVTLAKGIKLHYVHKGDSSRPLMLFLHGFPQFWYSWKNQMQEFSEDFWVVAPDMRGYGDSDKPTGAASYRADILVDDVKELLEALERPSATLVGHGWGAAVAWMFLERHPGRVDRLVSIGAPHPYVFQRAVALDSRQLLRSWYLFLFQVPLLAELVLRSDDLACLAKALRAGRRRPPTITDEELEAYKYTFCKPGALTAPLNYYRAAGWGLPRRWRRSATTRGSGAASGAGSAPSHCKDKDADEAEDEQEQQDSGADSTTLPDSPGSPPGSPPGSTPVLVVLGGRDAYVEHSTAFRTRKIFPNVSVIIVRDANHFVHLDDPAAVNKAMRGFLTTSPNTELQ